MKTLSAALLVAAVGLVAVPASAADAAAGKALFSTKCKTCHGAEGVPMPAMAKAMGIKPMSDPSIQAKTDAVLADEVLKGLGKMKAQAVTPADAENLIAFVRTLK